MRILFDCRALQLYPVGGPGFRGGTEIYVERVARGLAQKGHHVHVVTPDLVVEEWRGPSEWWWPPFGHPKNADVLVLVHSMQTLPDSGITAPLVVMASNGIDPPLLDDDTTRATVDAWPVFSACHKELLCKTRPAVDPDKCFITGLGVDLTPYSLLANGGLDQQEPGRLLYANDPQRGLWHLLDIFDELRDLVPDATLHIAYDFDRHFEAMKFHASAMAERMWDCKRRIECTPGILSLGALDRDDLVQEQLECQVHAMPSDPPNLGSQIHGITQMECAAAGAALVLSDTEAFPEIFGEAGTILPLPGTYLPSEERRCDARDWAEVIADLSHDPTAAGEKSRALAAQHTWAHVVGRWAAMLESLAESPEDAIPGEVVIA